MPAPLTQNVTVWLSTFVTLQTLDLVPVAATLVSPPGLMGIWCNIHPGTKEAEDATYALGVLNQTSALAYMAPASARMVPLRAILLDPVNLDAQGNHLAWLVRHQFTRNRFIQTTHSRLVLTLLTVRPTGLPL